MNEEVKRLIKEWFESRVLGHITGLNYAVHDNPDSMGVSVVVSIRTRGLTSPNEFSAGKVFDRIHMQDNNIGSDGLKRMVENGMRGLIHSLLDFTVQEEHRVS